jgi:cell division protein DivIC
VVAKPRGDLNSLFPFLPPASSHYQSHRLNWNRIISFIFLALFSGVGVFAGIFFLEMHRDLTAIRAEEAAHQRKLNEARERLDSQQKYLHRLRHDPALVERVIREKLRFVKADEFVFRFEDPASPPR